MIDEMKICKASIITALIGAFFLAAIPARGQTPAGAQSRATFINVTLPGCLPNQLTGQVTPTGLLNCLVTLANSTLFSQSALSDLPTGPSTLPTGFTYPNPILSGTVTLSSIVGTTQCLQVNAAGVISGTGVACGAGGGGSLPAPQDFISTTIGGSDFTPGTTQSLTLTTAPSSSTAIAIYFDGVHQSANTWSVSGSTVNFDAPITASFVVEVQYLSGGGGGGSGNVSTSGTLATGNIVIGAGGTGVGDSAISISAFPAPNVAFTPALSGGVSSTQQKVNSQVLYPFQFGAVPDGALINSGTVSINGGTPNLTVSSSQFVAGDVGGTIIISGAGTSGAPLLTTIAAYVSSTQVTLATNAGTTLSASSQTYAFGTNNLTALNKWLAACQSTGSSCSIGDGIYAFNGNLNITSGIQIIGNGASQSYLLGLSPSAQYLDVNSQASFEFKDFSVYGVNGCNSCGVSSSLVYITAPSGQNYSSAIDNLNFYGGGTSINAVNSSILRMDGLNANAMEVGISLQDVNSPYAGGYLITNSNIGCNVSTPSNSFVALNVESGGNVQAVNNLLHFCNYSIAIDPNVPSSSGSPFVIGDLFFSNNSLEQDGTASVVIDQAANYNETQDVTFVGGDSGGGSPFGIVNAVNAGTPTCYSQHVIVADMIIYPGNNGTGVQEGSGACLGGGNNEVHGNVFAAGGATTTAIGILSGAGGQNYGNQFSSGLTNTVVNSSGGSWTSGSVGP